MMRISKGLCGLLATGLMLTAATAALACPFCTPLQTLATQVAQADSVCLVRLVAGKPATDQHVGSSTYEVLQILKTPPGIVTKGDRIKVPQFRPGKAGDLFLMMGAKPSQESNIQWNSPTEASELAFSYVAQAPPPDVPIQKRLNYFVRFLEAPDQLVANDAYGELANAPYKDIAAVASLLPRDKIRGWLTDPKTPLTRLGVYGMLLGLCGNDDDAKLLAAKIAPSSEQFRLGLDGMISGYLLLTGSAGLDKIDDWKFKVHDGKKVAFSETNAAMMAVRFMWEYTGGRISNERLHQSMRLLLDQPELADLAITDLSRWKDWCIQGRLMSLYGKGDYNRRSIKRSIICYMAASADSKEDAESAARGKKYLEELRKKDPRTVREAQRFSYVK
jgi:hypothetical protein